MRAWGMLCLLLLAAGAQAHQRSTSYSDWQIAENSVQASLRIMQIDLTQVQLHPQQEEYLQRVAEYVATHIVVSNGQQSCKAGNGNAQSAAESGWIRVRLRWYCAPDGGPVQVRYGVLFDGAPNHVNLAVLRSANGQTHSRVFTVQRDTWADAPATAEHPQKVSGFFLLGMEHILTGWDHLCFLLVLVLFATAMREVIWLVTGFTLAHSLTLALAVGGHVIPDTAAVEWLVALSIVALAVENTWRETQYRGHWPLILLALVLGGSALMRVVPLPAVVGMGVFLAGYLHLVRTPDAPRNLRATVTFAFGLFHGFGFAGALSVVQIPAGQMVQSLLGFNLGVEAGQLLVLLVMVPILRLLRNQRREMLHVPNALVSMAACYWLAQRALVS